MRYYVFIDLLKEDVCKDCGVPTSRGMLLSSRDDKRGATPYCSEHEAYWYGIYHPPAPVVKVKKMARRNMTCAKFSNILRALKLKGNQPNVQSLYRIIYRNSTLIDELERLGIV